MACSSQLRAKLLQKENEAAVLKQVIQHIKLQAQHSVLRLHVLGVKTEGVIPDNMSSGAGHPGDSEDGVMDCGGWWIGLQTYGPLKIRDRELLPLQAILKLVRTA